MRRSDSQHRFTIRALLLATGLLGAAPSAIYVDPLVVLPADEACPAWFRDSEPNVAHTIEELMEIINGGAHFYGQYGFVAAAFQDYAGEVSGQPVTLTLSAFDQGTIENAQALYEDPGSGMGDPVTDWPGTGAARLRMAFGMITFQFWENSFYVSIVLPAGGEPALPDTRCMAESTLALIRAATPLSVDTWGRIKSAYR
jgi:hypothetical protein